MPSILEPVLLRSGLHLRNRVCMGAMTRNRNIDDHKPTEAASTHYGDRARDGTGLIVSEGIFISPDGCEFEHEPLLFTNDHVQAWKKVTDAVHQEGGIMFFQAWHAGRCQHDEAPLLKANNYPVLAPSNIKAAGGKYRWLEGMPGHTEKIMEIADPRDIVEQYSNSVRLAKEAGFDGVELLAQGGYLPQQFLNSRANNRADCYGGSVENRCRFLLEVADAMSQHFGYGNIIVKICPTDHVNDSKVSYNEMIETYTYLVKQLVSREVGIINLSRRGVKHLGTDPDEERQEDDSGNDDLPAFYEPMDTFGPLIKYDGSPTLLMVNHEYSLQEATECIEKAQIDLISFGRPFIYNPDVISRIKHGIPFAINDRGKNVNYGPFRDPNENYNDWPAAPIEETTKLA
ncbi:Aldolase-type TIM barrel [Paramyrothecium foliicola]|nr:Aldolase-type TIM barrel [Paramyrothecium foliicola]